jgi:hypothetical protein
VIPLTGRRLGARLLGIAVAACFIGGIVGVSVAGADSAWGGLLSLLIPGLGQIVAGDVGVGLLFLFLFLFILIDMFALFNRVLRLGSLPLAFLMPASALHAATGGAWWSIPAGGLGGLLAGVVLEQGNYRAKQRRLAIVRAARGDAPARVNTPAYAPIEHGGGAPMDQYTEAYLRYFMRFGHAEPTDWSIFDDPKHVDSALRYQMVLSAWAIYLTQHVSTPAFREAASATLGNIAERCRDYRVWNYTRMQNIRSFRIDGDPFRHENVMYSAYAADVTSMYEAMSGDHRYDEPGGYSVSDRSRTYEWSHEEIVDNLAVQHGASVHGSISCFPGWLFPVCQTFSLRSIQLGDLVHGTDHSWALERFRESFAKYFVSDHGHINTCRNIAGFPHPTEPFIVGVSGQAGSGAFISPFGREHVVTNYDQQIRPRMSEPDSDGRITLRLSKIDTFDTSYGWNPAQPYSIALLYATEMGDAEAAAGLRHTLEEMLTPDGDRPGPGSILSMAITFMALGNAERGLAAAHRHVPAHDTTPELEHAPYPQVIVTAAHATADSVTASLVPGPSANGEVYLRFGRLQPGARYRLSGAGEPRELDADATGRVEAKVPSSQQHDLVLERIA